MGGEDRGLKGWTGTRRAASVVFRHLLIPVSPAHSPAS